MIKTYYQTFLRLFVDVYLYLEYRTQGMSNIKY